MNETEEVLFEITEHDQTKILMPGGRGGLGNDHFKTSTHQTRALPNPANPDRKAGLSWNLKSSPTSALSISQCRQIHPAVGCIGRQTWNSRLSLTTLTPNLGIVSYRDGASFVMAISLAIIEGAHEGRGLGLRFLRHIERNSLLLFLSRPIPKTSGMNMISSWMSLKSIIPNWPTSHGLLAISKSDLLDAELKSEMKLELPKVKTVFISSVTGKGSWSWKIWSGRNWTAIQMIDLDECYAGTTEIHRYWSLSLPWMARHSPFFDFVMFWASKDGYGSLLCLLRLAAVQTLREKSLDHDPDGPGY